MCTLCNKAKNIVQKTIDTSNSWLHHAQRLHHATMSANKKEISLDNEAERRLGVCGVCHEKKESDLVDTANNFVLPETTAKRFDKYLNYQCGRCGCSCVLLAYDNILPCDKWI